MRALCGDCGLNVIPHWLNRSSTLAVQTNFNGNKYITPKYKYRYKYSKMYLSISTSTKYPISAVNSDDSARGS